MTPLDILLAPEDVIHVSIDFGNGQIEHLYVSGSTYPIIRNYTVAYTDLSSKLVSVNAHASRPTNPPSILPWSQTLTRYNYARSVESPTYQTPDETVTIGGINAHIKYAPSNSAHQLKKPIIFVEGIDFGRRTLCDYMGKPVKVGAFGWDTFITGMVEDPTDSDNETFAMLPTFANDMMAHDMVFCDFRDGTASIEDNGQSMIAVINEVNRRKQANLSPRQNCYTNSIVGASMGGQVVRWALKTMENQNTEHDCKLYFSLDSPHKGATIPLGLQAFIRFGAEHGQEDGTRHMLREKWQSLNIPAPKQLLAFHLANNGEHTAYINMMNQLGYPQKTRNIKGNITQGQTNKVDCFLSPYVWVEYRVKNINSPDGKDTLRCLAGLFTGKNVDKPVIVKTTKLWTKPDSVYWSVVKKLCLDELQETNNYYPKGYRKL